MLFALGQSSGEAVCFPDNGGDRVTCEGLICGEVARSHKQGPDSGSGRPGKDVLYSGYMTSTCLEYQRPRQTVSSPPDLYGDY